MLEYQQALEKLHNGADDRTIPEALFAIHPLTLYQEMPQILENCQAIQEQVLKEILTQARDSAYGKDHNFAQLIDNGEWRDKAESTTYQNYQPYIEREMMGEPHQLFTNDTELYIATTGSTGSMKYFVESKAGNAAKQLIMAVRGMYMSALLPVTLDMEAKNLTISNYAPVGTSADGKLIVRASGQTARNMRKKTGTMNIIPVEFWESTGITPKDRDYMMAVYALADVRFSKVFCNNLIHLGRILDRINAEGNSMIEDIRRGDFSVPMPDEVRAELMKLFPANSERADYLREIYNQHGGFADRPDIYEAIWPNLSMVSCWLSGSVGRDAREVLRRLPRGIKCFEMGYGASEGKLNIPTRLASAAGVVAPFNCFYEFRPINGGKPLCMWEVEDGAYYELLITTYSGLYRYNMQDVVRIDGFVGNTPNITFCGKSSEMVWAGETNMYGYLFTELLHQVEHQHNIKLDVAQLYSDENGYYYLFESKLPVDYVQLKQIMDERTNELWGVKSKALYVMKPTYKNYLFTERTIEGRGACGIKLPVVLEEMPVAEQIETVITI